MSLVNSGVTSRENHHHRIAAVLTNETVLLAGGLAVDVVRLEGAGDFRVHLRPRNERFGGGDETGHSDGQAQYGGETEYLHTYRLLMRDTGDPRATRTGRPRKGRPWTKQAGSFPNPPNVRELLAVVFGEAAAGEFLEEPFHGVA